MKILNSSILVQSFKNSSFFNALGRSFKHSAVVGFFTKENNKIFNYSKTSKLLPGRQSGYVLSEDTPVLSKVKLPKWLAGSWFVDLIWTWKDCEGDDKNS